MGRILNGREAGGRIGKPEKTMANWRSAGVGPAYYKVGGSVRYDEDDLDAWLAEHRIVPSGDVA